jgi:hypothetical protein
MKTTFLPAVIFLFSFTNLSAQNTLPKGTLLLGGNFSIQNEKSEQPSSISKSTGFSVNPAIGKAIKDNLFLGLNLGYSYAHTRNYNSAQNFGDSTKSNGFNYSLFLRKYKPVINNFYIFLQSNAGGYNVSQKSNATSQVNNSSNNSFGLTLSLSPGISYAINKKLQLEAGLNNIVGVRYTESKNKTVNNTTKSSSINLTTSLDNFNSQLSFGFRLLLQKKDKMVVSSK